MPTLRPALELGLLWLGGGAVGQPIGDTFINRGGQGVLMFRILLRWLARASFKCWCGRTLPRGV